MKNFTSKYYPQLLLLILAFSFFTRMYNLHVPEKYVFDEVYHAVTAKLIVDNDVRAYEWTNPPPEPNTAVDWLHPPLAKYTQALSMKLFAKNSFGWRFSSVIFGVIVVFLTARLALNLFKSKQLSLLAALIVSLDGLVLVMSRIAMNDIHVTAFILLALNFYTLYINSKRKNRKFLIFSAIAAGLAMGTKWSGVFALLIIGFFEAINFLKNIATEKNQLIFTTTIGRKKLKIILKETLLLSLTLLVIPILIYILSYSHMFMLGKDFNHLIEMHKNTWWYQTTLTATHPAQSKPIDWFLNLKPVWIHAEWGKGVRGDIFAFGNPLVFWIGDIFVFISLAYIIYLIKKLIKLKKAQSQFSPANKKHLKKEIKIDLEKNIKKSLKIKSKLYKLSYLVFIYFILWLPWQLSPRIMFFYHYLPAVPLLSINMAYWLNKMINSKNEKLRFITVFILVALFITFVVWYPHWVGIKVPIEIKDSLYFAIESWKQS